MNANNIPHEVPDYYSREFRVKNNNYCICVFVINEGEKLLKQIDRMRPVCNNIVDIVIADGGSKDGSTDEVKLRNAGVNTLLVKTGTGKLGSQMRMAFDWALKRGYEGVVVIDGNGKDGVEAIPRFVEQLKSGVDHVQGSRFIPGGHHENTPKSRMLGLKLLHIPLMRFASGFKYTDTTNGFRAYSAKLLASEQLAIFRNCFESYELHYYLAIEAARNDFNVKEIPVSRVYPPSGKIPTKISPISGNLNVINKLLKSVSRAYCPQKTLSKTTVFLLCLNLLVFLCLYVPNVLSPLRLHTDAVRLFKVALPAVNGYEYGKDQFPILYPMLLKHLMSHGLCNNTVLMLIHFTCLLIGYFFIYYFFKKLQIKKALILVIILMTQLFYCLSKNSLVAASDISYFPLFWANSFFLLSFYQEHSKRKQLFYLLMTGIILFVSLNLRTMSIAFIPAIVICCLFKLRTFILNHILAFIAMISFFAIACFLYLYKIDFFSETGYFYSMIMRYKNLNSIELYRIILHPFAEFTACFFNLTINKIPFSLAVILGIFVACIYAGGALISSILKKEIICISIFVCFLVMIWGWPYVVVRYWMYLIPIMIYWTYSFFHIIDLKILKVLFKAYVLLYCLIGVLVMCFLLKQTFSGKDIGEIYGNGCLREYYRCAFKNGKKYSPEIETSLTVFILEKFDTRYGTRNNRAYSDWQYCSTPTLGNKELQ